jgi:hypothetical protein
LDVVQPESPKLFKAVDPDAEAPDPAPEPPKHSSNPGFTEEPSEDQDISFPATTTTTCNNNNNHHLRQLHLTSSNATKASPKYSPGLMRAFFNNGTSSTTSGF